MRAAIRVASEELLLHLRGGLEVPPAHQFVPVSGVELSAEAGRRVVELKHGRDALCPTRSAKISPVAASGDLSPASTASITRTASPKKPWKASIDGQYEPTRGWCMSVSSCSREAFS